MADLQNVPAPPPPGEIVSERQLYLTQISLYRNSLAFGGQRNPTAIWGSMVRNESTTMLYYRELEDKDEDVGNCLDSLKLSVLERDRSIQPADDSQQAADIASFVEEQIAALPNFHATLDCMLDAPGYGFSIQEMIFDTSMGQAGLVEINDCPQELFLFGNRFQPQIGQLQFLDSPYAMEGLKVPEQKFLIFTHRGRSRNRMGRALLKNVFWPSWFKRNIMRLWVQYAEKGPGTCVVRYQDGGNESEKQQAAGIAQAIVDNTAVAVPNNFSYDQELMKIARSQDPAVYEHFFQAMQYSIARRILGETLTSFGNEGGTGSKAQGGTHADTLEKKSVELCRMLETVVNQQLVRPLVIWNFGPNVPMPKWGFDLEEQEDLAKRIGIDSALQGMGVPMGLPYLRERYDVPIPGPQDDIAKPTPNAPMVNIRDTGGGSSFSEDDPPPSVESEMSEFDKLMDQLQGDARGIFKERIREVANAVKPTVVK